jgi:hypothetical protein
MFTIGPLSIAPQTLWGFGLFVGALLARDCWERPWALDLPLHQRKRKPRALFLRRPVFRTTKQQTFIFPCGLL